MNIQSSRQRLVINVDMWSSNRWWHHDMEILLITGHLCGESLGYWWIPQRASDEEIWWHICCKPGQTTKWTVGLPVNSDTLTLNVRGPSYLSLTRSISCYWCPGFLRRQDISSHDIDYVEYVCPGLTWGRILSTCVIWMWSNDIKCKYMFMFSLKNLAHKGLITLTWHPCNVSS